MLTAKERGLILLLTSNNRFTFLLLTSNNRFTHGRLRQDDVIVVIKDEAGPASSTVRALPKQTKYPYDKEHSDSNSYASLRRLDKEARTHGYGRRSEEPLSSL